MKVLFCADGSDSSNYAIEKALHFLKPDCEIHLLNVIDWGIFPNFVTFPYETEEGFPTHRNIAQQVLKKTEENIRSKGFQNIKDEVLFGHAGDMIMDYINSEKPNLIVMGSHGKKGIAKWLGSISRRVVSKAPVPVFIAKMQKTPPTEGKNILFAADGSKYSVNAAEISPDLLDFSGCSAEIINVRAGADSLPVEIAMDEEWLKKIIQKQQELSIEILDKTFEILNNKGIHNAKKIAVEGDAAEEILNYIKDHKKDLIIMGSHGREGFSEMLIGSVSKRVLDFSDSPVLIVPTLKSQKSSS